MSNISKLWKKPAKPAANASGSETAFQGTVHSVGQTLSVPENASEKPKGGFRANLRKHFSRSNLASREPSPAPSLPVSAADVSTSASATDVSSQNLLSERKNMQFKTEMVDAETRMAMLDLGIQVIDLFQPVASAAELVLPSSLGEILEKVTGILEVLKKMIENREAWRELLLSIDNHQEVFNNQLKRIKLENLVPDPESPLLSPVKSYASALESLAAKVMEESGLLTESTVSDNRWTRVKKFGSRFLNIDSESQSIEQYARQLQGAMDQFNLALSIFTSFAVHYIKGGVDSISQSIKDVRETIIRASGPKDDINSRHITALGGQHSICLPGTRVDVLEDVRQWARAQRVESPIYCIRDVAGTGKSTIARTLADEWDDSNCLAFFFSQEGSSVRDASDFCFFIKKQIRAYCHDPILTEYWNSLSADSLDLLRSKPIENQWKKLIYEPLSKLPQDRTYILVIDAVDECTVSTRGTLLKCLLSACSSGSLPHLRALLTTRNEEDIRLILDHPSYCDIIQSKSLRHAASTNKDIAMYVNYRLDENGLFVSAPEQRKLLIHRCDGVFIFASLACKLLEDSGTDDGPLDKILERFTSLDALYHQALERADKEPEFTRPALKSILGIILVAQEPLSTTAIAELLSTPLKPVETLIGRLGSILSSGAADQLVSVLHATFTEFLVRQTWGTANLEVTNEYALSRSQSNRLMAHGCISALLEDDKCGPSSDARNSARGDPGTPRHPGEVLKQKTTAAFRYAASAWIAHSIPELHIPRIVNNIRRIFHEKLLNWIEQGALHKQLPDYMRDVHRLQEGFGSALSLFNCVVHEDDVQWCRDTLEFMQSNQDLLPQLPLHVYSSALTFTPRQSQIYQAYARMSLPRIVVGHPTRASGELVLVGNTGSVRAVTYSANGELLASVDGRGIVIWDARTGAKQWDHNLEGDDWDCVGVSLLPEQRVVVSVWKHISLRGQGHSRLYRLNCETRGLLCPPEDLEIPSQLCCITWIPDLSGFACGTGDGKIYLFILGARLKRRGSINAHEDAVTSLSFSQDRLTMVSTSWDKTIKIWTMTNEELTGPTTVLRHTKAIRDAAFSPADSSLVAFVDTNLLYIYNISTSTMQLILDFGEFTPYNLVYSHDGAQITLQDLLAPTMLIINTISKDPNGRPMIRRLDTGHTEEIICLAFSPDDKHLVTGSNDESLRIHDLVITTPLPRVAGHRRCIESLSFSLDGRWLASVEYAGNSCIWDVEGGCLAQDAIRTGMDDPHVAMSSDGSIFAFAEETDDIRFWSMKLKRQVGASLSLGYPEAETVYAMAFSLDDTKLAIGTAKDQIVLLSVQNAHGILIQPCIAINIGPGPGGMPLAFHPSGKYICFTDHAWDITNKPPNRVTGHKFAAILKETSPFLRFNDGEDEESDASPSPSISLGSPPRQVFYIPRDFKFYTHTTHHGRIALGAEDGRVMVIDFTHLATEEEKFLLDRIEAMRGETATRSGPSRLYEVLSSYSGPPKIVVPFNNAGKNSDSDLEGLYLEDVGSEDEDVEDEGEATVNAGEDGKDVVNYDDMFFEEV